MKLGVRAHRAGHREVLWEGALMGLQSSKVS